MMKNLIRTTVKKYVLPKVFDQLAQVEIAVEHIIKTDDAKSQLTLLVKQEEDFSADIQSKQQNIWELETYCKNLLGRNTEYGFFKNPEIGTVFVAGPLSNLFLYDVDGKKLGAMTEGPYGILRGLEIEEPVAAKYVKKLNQGLHLLLIRTNRFDLDDLKDFLGKMGSNTF